MSQENGAADPGLVVPREFDLAISFAGTERPLAEELAMRMRDAGFDVFYDGFYPEQLRGKDLAAYFDQVYRRQCDRNKDSLC